MMDRLKKAVICAFTKGKAVPAEKQQRKWLRRKKNVKLSTEHTRSGFPNLKGERLLTNVGDLSGLVVVYENQHHTIFKKIS